MTGIETKLNLAMPDAEKAVREALGAEGFGVLTEIDVAATLKAKLGVERSGLKILGACNPSLAHRALGIDPSAALVLPCNVVLEEEAPQVTKITIADPHELMPSDEFAELAAEAGAHLKAVTERLAA